MALYRRCAIRHARRTKKQVASSVNSVSCIDDGTTLNNMLYIISPHMATLVEDTGAAAILSARSSISVSACPAAKATPVSRWFGVLRHRSVDKICDVVIGDDTRHLGKYFRLLLASSPRPGHLTRRIASAENLQTWLHRDKRPPRRSMRPR